MLANRPYLLLLLFRFAISLLKGSPLMSNVYSLADLKASLDKEFAPVEIDLGRTKVTLRNVMRLPKNERAKVMEAAKVFTDQDSNPDLDQSLEAIHTILRTAADTPSKGEALVAQVGDDLALGMKIVNLWMEATQPGEAQNSPS